MEHLADPPTPIGKSLRVQRRVLGALLMREVLTRFGRANIGFLWLFVEPMIFTLGVAALWTFAGFHRASNIPIIAFAVTGYSTVLLWRNMTGRCIGAVEPNLSLLYHRNVKILDVFAARLLLEAAGALTSFLVLSLVCTWLGWMELPEDPLQVAMAFALLAWFGAGLGLLLGSWSEQNSLVEKLWQPLTYILFPLSGAAFIVDALPTEAQDYILLLPMVHGAELMREGYFGSFVRSHYDIGYLVLCNVVLTLAGLAKTRVLSQHVTPE